MNTITIHASGDHQKISRHIYGHFAEHLGRCITDGLWVGEDSPIPNTRGIRSDIVEALRRIKAPNLRWPGGCFADIYDWRDGIGPKAQRPVRRNFWGNVPEDNHFGTHEFMDLCEQVGCEAYIGGNVGSGNVREMRDWIEYLTSNDQGTFANQRRKNGRDAAWSIPFWGIGNENWGCGGNMTPEYYADLYCQYQNFIRNYADTPMMKIASGYGGSDTEGKDLAIFMDKITNRRFPVKTDGISIHYYVYLRNQMQHSATKFGDSEWFTVLKMANHIGHVIEENSRILDRFDPEKRMWLIVDEWGTWYPNEPGTNPEFLYQQNSMRDAVVAAHTLHLFQAHSDRVKLANIAQTVNVLQAMILTQGEQMILTPSYHVFDMFKAHQDATLLPVDLACETYASGDDSLPAISVSASRSDSGQILLTLCNLNPRESQSISCAIPDAAVTAVEGFVLAADDMTAHNTFEQPDRVQPTVFHGAAPEGQHRLNIQLPAASVVALTLS
ncbi:MAG: alpha-N-arabinofuranosidase [Chloroflexi bacterium]|nr:alpha-N-arabinofuranosidase [Chloroflexota bacterium]